MKTVFVLFMSLAAIVRAQDPQQPEEQKRLQSVTWDLNSHKLVWVVEKGVEQNGQFISKTTDRYEISPDNAVMSFANERRGFTEEEAASLSKLLDTLSLYCAESVIWWDQGEGDKLDGPETPGNDSDTPKKEKVQSQPHSHQPAEAVADPLLVASGARLP
jgi:hypothetical protein